MFDSSHPKLKPEPEHDAQQDPSEGHDQSIVPRTRLSKEISHIRRRIGLEEVSPRLSSSSRCGIAERQSVHLFDHLPDRHHVMDQRFRQWPKRSLKRTEQLQTTQRVEAEIQIQMIVRRHEATLIKKR